MRRISHFIAALMVTACSSVEPKPEQTVTEAVTPPMTDPQPAPQTLREQLIAEHGKAFLSDYGTSVQSYFAVIRVVYDSNGNGIADPDETTISNTNVFASYASGGGTRINAQGITNAKGTALFELPIYFSFGFGASAPVTNDQLAAWTQTNDQSEPVVYGSYPENSIQQKNVLLACRDANTGKVIPRPVPNATGIWRCANNTFSSITGSWRTLGTPIETYGYLKHFGIPKNAPEKVTVVLGWSGEEWNSNQGTSFHQLENAVWREAATKFEARWKNFPGQNGETLITESIWGHPPFVVDSFGHFSVLQPNDNLDATVLKTWRDGAWKTEATIANEVLNLNRSRYLGVDSSDRPTRTRDTTTGQTLEEFWDGNRWRASGFMYPTIDINASQVVRTTNAKVYHFMRGGFGINPTPSSKLLTLEAGRWIEKDAEPEFPGRRFKTCDGVWAVKSARLMISCRQQVEVPGILNYYSLPEIQTVSLLRDDGWQTIYYKGPWTDLQVDPAGNPVMVSISEGKLFAQRWDGQQWQRLGTAINGDVSYLGGGRLAFGEDGRMVIAWFGRETQNSSKLYVSEFTP